MHKKILFISDHGDPLAPLGGEQAGGQNKYVKELALALEAEGNQVDVITHWANPNDPQIETFGNFCRVIRIAAGQKKYVSKNQMLPMLPAFYEEMAQTIDIASYDLMHTHYWLSGLLGISIKKDYHLPWVHTSHSLGVAKARATGIADPVRHSNERRILRSCDTIVATSESEKSLIKGFVNQPSPIQVIPIGTDENFQPCSEKRNIATPYFAFAGRLEKTKGIYTLINAFRNLVENQEIPDYTKLIIAGGDAKDVDTSKKLPRDGSLKNAIHGLENRIEFIGAQSQEQLVTLFNNSVATVVPSYYESFGMVAVEAQACGRPVIASKVGGLNDVVKHMVTGLHTEKANAKSVANAMKTLLSNPSFADELGRKAAAFADYEFRWPALAERMDTLYEVMLHERETLYAGYRS